MSTILFAWELGAGSGHLSPYQSVITELARLGHRVYFAARDVATAAQVLQDTGARVLAAPILLGQPPLYYQKPLNFAQILHNIGFHETASLAGRVGAWCSLFDLVRPDLLIVDHSPTALLASHALGIRRMVLGSGFLVPPRSAPFPNMRDWMRVDQGRLLQQEKLVLDTANRVLGELSRPALGQLHELYQVEATRLTTFAELDHYYPRDPGLYLGVGYPGAGLEPEWPALPGKRIFAYLKRTKYLDEVLRALGRTNLPVVARVADFPPPLRQGYGASIRFADHHVDMAAVQASADLLVCNGNHGSMAHALLGGLPLVLLPDTLERVMGSRKAARLGAAEMVQIEQKDIGQGVSVALQQVLDNDHYRIAASRFAANYADHDLGRHDRELLELAVKLLT